MQFKWQQDMVLRRVIDYTWIIPGPRHVDFKITPINLSKSTFEFSICALNSAITIIYSRDSARLFCST